jgi:hypothetical protein
MQVEAEMVMMIWEFLAYLKRDTEIHDIKLSLYEIVEAMRFQGR